MVIKDRLFQSTSADANDVRPFPRTILAHVDFGLFPAHSKSMSTAKKSDAKAREKKTPGTIMAAEVRARANRLTDAERESLTAYAMRVIYGEKSNAAHAHRR